jgi:Mrp family chromosome partitioning ATPase
MEPIDYTGALKRSWRLLIVLALLGAVIAVLLPVSAPAKGAKPLKWQASALVGSIPPGKGSPLGGGVTGSQIYFYATSSAVQNGTAKISHLNIPSYEYYRYMTATVVAPGTTALKQTTGSTTPLKRNSATEVLLTGYGKTPAQAIAIANLYAYVLGSAIQQAANGRAAANAAAAAAKSSNASTSSDSGSSDGTSAPSGFVVQQPAQFATHSGTKTSLGSSRKVRLVAGLILGALIGAGIVLLRELLDKRLRSATRAESNFGFPVVVEIPSQLLKAGQSVAGQSLPVDVVREPDSAGAEAYRMLRMSVLFESLAPQTSGPDGFGYEYGQGMPLDAPRVDMEGPGATIGERRVVMVVSAGTEPSRPHVAANLAAIYGEAGQRVIVVSTGDIEAGTSIRQADGRRAVVTRDDVEARMQPSRLEFVSRLPLGSFIANSGELVTRGRAVLDAARTLADVVIVEVPPLLAVHHAEALARAVDVVLVVGECGVTTFNDARRAGDVLRRIDAPVLGVVLTNVRINQKDVRLAVPRRIVPVAPEPETEVREAVLALGPGAGAPPDGGSPTAY